MTTHTLDLVDLSVGQTSFPDELRRGLSQPRKSIPPRFLYDAEGSRLFEEICVQPEYHVTRAELQLLQAHAAEIARLIGPMANLIEFGAGSAAKACVLLAAMTAPMAYVPIDVSTSALGGCLREAAERFPGLELRGLLGSYLEPPLPQLPAHGRRLGFFSGATIGNLSPPEAQAFLRMWRAHLGEDSLLLVGVDLRKEPAAVQAAYDDAAGVTRAFILNILARANREADATFDLDAFVYRPEYDAEAGRMRMELESTRAQRVRIGPEWFAFDAGERLHVEDSWKYSLREFQALALAAGWQVERSWTDRDQRFSSHLLGAGEAYGSSAPGPTPSSRSIQVTPEFEGGAAPSTRRARR